MNYKIGNNVVENKVEKELKNKKTDLNNIRAKIAERDGKTSDF